MKVVSIDFETANNNCGSVCAVGLCTLEDGSVEESFYSLIKPIDEVNYFNKWNIRIHGITEEDVKDAPEFKAVYGEMLPLFEDAIIVAHNANFDMSCLKEASKLSKLPIPKLRYVDTIRIAKKVFPNLERYGLSVVSEHIECELNHHNAISDAKACLMIVAQAMNLTGIFDMEELCKKLGVKIHEI